MAKKKSKKGLFITIIALLALCSAAIVWFMMNKKSGPVLVSVEPVAARTITQTVNAIGRIQPEQMVKISSEASGEIIFLGVRDGASVQMGQLLVRIQPDLVESQLAQTRASTEASRLSINVARAEYVRAEADLKRVNELYKKDFASREELDRARASFETASSRVAQAQSDYMRAQAMLQQTQATASRTTIFAPMSGVVTFLGVERGEKVVGTAQMQGTEMMRIADLSVMNAWVDVDENDVALLSIGDTARIRVDALSEVSLRGVVYEISHSPKVSGQGSQEEVVNFQVRIRLVDKDARMRPGMSCSVDIETETKPNVLSVPIQAVTIARDEASPRKLEEPDPGQKEKRSSAESKQSKPQSMVWTTDGTTVQSRIVETGISDAGFIEIKEGLKNGERIVTSPYQAISKLLKNGASIRLEDPSTRKERFREMRENQ